MKNAEKELPIFVVGFPKSGNTWLLRILCDVIGANIDQPDAVNRAGFDKERERLIHKIHFAHAANVQGRIIYIVRDVRDVLVSGFFFNNPFVRERSVLLHGGVQYVLHRLYFRHQIQRMNRRWCGNEYAELNNWLRGRTGRDCIGLNWSDHVAYWTGRPDVLVVRYEDLLADTLSTVKNVLGFLDERFQLEDLEHAVASNSMEAKREEFANSGDVGNYKFLRKGRKGDWIRFLDEGLLREIMKRHGKALHKMGYAGHGE